MALAATTDRRNHVFNAVPIVAALLVGAALDDPTAVWKSIAQPTLGGGVIEEGGWTFAYYREVADPKAKGFEDLQRAGAQQEALEALVYHCCGKPEIPADVTDSVRRILELSIADRWSYRASTAGITWVELIANDKETCAVAALPANTCAGMPRRGEWRSDGLTIATNSESWIVPAALVEVADLNERDQVLAIVDSRASALLPTASTGWPAGWVRLPDGIPKKSLEALSIDDLLKVARSRAGDRMLWDELIERKKAEGFVQAATSLRRACERSQWPVPAPCPTNTTWLGVDVQGFPASLIATIRSGGSILCRDTPSKAATARAKAAYFAKVPDVGLAEREAIAACANPDADALNLLAAIRLASDSPSSDQLLQALAFAQQAIVLMPSHQFATVNNLRALKALGLKNEARAVLARVPPPPKGSWQEKHVDTVREWLSTAAPH